jgi:capsular polysaccharide biosynthesis protein
MSDNNNVLLAGGLVLAFLMLNRRQAAPVAYSVPPGAVASMPSSVGNGWQQLAQGAVAGLLGALANGPANNTSQSYFPSYADPVDAYRGDIAQEAAGDWIGWY